MNLNLADSAIKDLRKLEARLTRDIKLQAVRAGWPKELASVLRVTVANDEILVNYPNEKADEIEDLEYGTRAASPKPVFRSFINKHGSVISESLENWVLKTLSERDSR